jgi:hypothetical protein
MQATRREFCRGVFKVPTKRLKLEEFSCFFGVKKFPKGKKLNDKVCVVAWECFGAKFVHEIRRRAVKFRRLWSLVNHFYRCIV